MIACSASFLVILAKESSNFRAPIISKTITTRVTIWLEISVNSYLTGRLFFLFAGKRFWFGPFGHSPLGRDLEARTARIAAVIRQA